MTQRRRPASKLDSRMRVRVAAGEPALLASPDSVMGFSSRICSLWRMETPIYARPPDRSHPAEIRAEYLQRRTAGHRLHDAQPWPREKRCDVRAPRRSDDT